MPLSFESMSHGHVAFGFFNIDVDLLLLDRALFYADGFARVIEELAAETGVGEFECSVDGHRAPDARSLGNTMGAIHGFDRGGLIGAVYDRFPFPTRPEEFRQHPDGATHRDTIAPLLEGWTAPACHRVVLDPVARTVTVAGITFSWPWFQELVAYVWRGGYPRWRDERRPEFLHAMRGAVEASRNRLFSGQAWELRRIDLTG